MSCCGSKNNKFYTRANVGKTCCNNYYQNNYCSNEGTSTSNSCCGNQNSYNSSCCNQSSNSDYSESDNCCNYNNNLNGLSCPFHNNNDCCCENSLKNALCNLTNQRVIIHTDGCKMCVVIVSVGDCFVKTINPCTQKIVYFNINRIDNVEDVLPRCY